MSDISPEDRERLAKTKFKEWMHELFPEEFDAHFEKKVSERRSVQGAAPQQGQLPQQQHQPERKRSLIEECISNALGIG